MPDTLIAKPRLLVACECSERVTMAFREKGVDAWSCDIKPSEIEGYPYHIQDDVLKHLDDEWDGGIFHPDCTYSANSGVRWLQERQERWFELCRAIKFFKALQDANIPFKAIENPIPHKYAREFIGDYTQIIHPHYFGDPESKATCLWLSGFPKLIRTHFMNKSEIKQSTWKEPPSPERKTDRARTFPGIADAMANQWAPVLLEGK